MAVIAAHPRAMHHNLAAVEADLSLGHAPPVADAASAAAVQCTGEPPCVPAQHLFYRSNAGRQTEALERAVHILPSQFEAWKKRNSCCCGNIGHGVALLCGFVTPSLRLKVGNAYFLFQHSAGQSLTTLRRYASAEPWSNDPQTNDEHHDKPIDGIRQIR